MKYKKQLYGEANNLNLKVLIGLSRNTQMIYKRSANIFSKAGLTTAQFAVLEALYHKGDLSINEIIQSILSTPGNMTVVINNLKKDQLAYSYTNPEDKRSSVISITEKGKKKIEEIFPNHLKDLEECFKVLSIEEKQLLISLLKKLGAK